MLLVSAAALVSGDGAVFFDLGGAFVTGFTGLGEKMSSLKQQRCSYFFGLKILIK